ncbi:putative helicase/DNA methylase domain protein [Helicobacter pylori Hp A-9]|uniref:Putative helicase/DNA methylase domain protein n=1 Tax=Helicobacter pylori Hp A-9 TaxID=992034 RepID=J0JZK0_HELPX|nr:putative helicase/DNA methylase domain protein [Helicobacter pylori Hp A-9]
METKALDRMGAQIKRTQGVGDLELLKEAQINQYYYLLKADYILQDSSHQMDLETLNKTGIKREDFYQI